MRRRLVASGIREDGCSSHPTELLGSRIPLNSRMQILPRILAEELTTRMSEVKEKARPVESPTGTGHAFQQSRLAELVHAPVWRTGDEGSSPNKVTDKHSDITIEDVLRVQEAVDEDMVIQPDGNPLKREFFLERGGVLYVFPFSLTKTWMPEKTFFKKTKRKEDFLKTDGKVLREQKK